MDHWEYLLVAERKYAILLAKYERAEHAVEVIVGLKAIAAADAKIQAKKAKLKAEMDRIAATIRNLCDPNWTPGHIEPFLPKPYRQPAGDISKHAYKIMRAEKRPMGSRELAKMIASRLGLENPDSKELLRIDVAIRKAFGRRVKAGQLIELEGKPKRWIIKPREASGASASNPPTSVSEPG